MKLSVEELKNLVKESMEEMYSEQDDDGGSDDGGSENEGIHEIIKTTITEALLEKKMGFKKLTKSLASKEIGRAHV